MKWDMVSRIVGIAALVAFAVVASQGDIGSRELLLLVIGVVALVSPDALDNIPIGPNTPE